MDIYRAIVSATNGICGLGGFRVVWCTEAKLGHEDEVFPHQTKNPPPPPHTHKQKSGSILEGRLDQAVTQGYESMSIAD